jgi:hypothetical protein
MPDVLTRPDPDEPDDQEPAADYLIEDQLRDLGIDPDLVRILAPHATELRALDGSRCWSREDLSPLLEGA